MERLLFTELRFAAAQITVPRRKQGKLMLTIWLTGEEAAAHHYPAAAVHFDAAVSYHPSSSAVPGPSLEETAFQITHLQIKSKVDIISIHPLTGPTKA